MPNPRCYFDIEIGGAPAGRLVFELFVTRCPKTAENFRALCVGQKTADGRMLHYKGHAFHRVINWFVLQGGDITHGTGEGGESIYGKLFDDENLTLSHSRPGILSMANFGRNTNSSQFIIATGPRYNLKHLDGVHVVFGGLVKGWNTLRMIEAVPTVARDRPAVDVIVADCGELEEGISDGVLEPKEGNPYMDHPEDQGVPQLLKQMGAESFYLDSDASTTNMLGHDLETLMKVGEEIKQLGNQCFRIQDYQEALLRYQQALRYLRWCDAPLDTVAWKDLVASCYNNAAACQLKLGHNELALEACDKLLEMDSKNAKGYFRRATAYKAMHDYEKCLRDVKRAIQLEPSDAACKRLEKEAQELLAQQTASSSRAPQ